ncbi:DNA repair protein RadA [Thermus thermophilus]|uniref:DNA repair protein RadA n=1 Tax=Thermus thermophilus TaxID=274 RepID=UPI001FCC032D|nr:DNA repair protein RadA [Thermus thermophilus]BDG18373.1 DNA repair protein RadA [Thermus thermophilus]BDG23370.1 DNA repair protein RadA [Thermus thermophilus]
MAKATYACVECGYRTPKPLGRCPSCGSWESFQEVAPAPASRRAKPSPLPLLALSQVDEAEERRFSSGLSEVDRVLGGGFVTGEVVLLGGEPGVGKSTLLLEMAKRMPQRVYYVAGEESPAQIKLRAQRLGVKDLLLVRETRLEPLLALLEEDPPEVLFVDSVQTLEAGGSPGSLVAVREATSALVRFAKERGVTVVLVGHVTKEGVVAGPKSVEHAVDATLYLETAGPYRVLRSAKNRFGPVGEIGVFRMEEAGLLEVENPSEAFLKERPLGVPGSAVALALAGERALALEVQALAAKTPFPAPRRVVQGLDGRRVDVVLAVLERRLGLPLANLDVYVNLAGGLKVQDPGLDLAVALAVYSAVVGRPLPADLALVGEVGLAGEVRRVAGLERRLREGERAGFGRFLHPGNLKRLQEAVEAYLA